MNQIKSVTVIEYKEYILSKNNLIVQTKVGLNLFFQNAWKFFENDLT